jgi:hypothetical protein
VVCDRQSESRLSSRVLSALACCIHSVQSHGMLSSSPPKSFP